MIIFSDKLRLRYPRLSRELESILRAEEVDYKFQGGFKDIWVRDFYPINSINGWAKYIYHPDYLIGHSRSRTKFDDLKWNLPIVALDLILDGGNVVMSPDKKTVIVCDKIFDENPRYPKSTIRSRIETTFGCNLLIIPTDQYDVLGHADGYVRWAGSMKLIVSENAYSKESCWSRFKQVTSGYEIVYLPNPIDDTNDRQIPSAFGCYINFLHYRDLLIMPLFGIPQDDQAFALLEQHFRNCRIKTVNAAELSKEGGILNCICAESPDSIAVHEPKFSTQ